MTFADNIRRFNKGLAFHGELPPGIRILNPFEDSPEIIALTDKFYDQFYGDTQKRKMILGINPGRFGAAVTGIPFTDTRKLEEMYGLKVTGKSTHEPSATFIYDMIEAYGGVGLFFRRFYINSICPLALIRKNERGNWVNCNYYDYPQLFDAVKDFAIACLKAQVDFGIDRSVCYVLGKKNAKFFKRINDQEKIFDRIEVLEHPRYIVQYKLKQKDEFIAKYLETLEAFQTN